MMALLSERGRAFVSLMETDHDHLERLFQSVMTCLRGADVESLRARWLELDRALQHHLTLEEELLLPRFERAFPTSAARLRREHREIREALVQFGVDLDLHELSPGSAQRFVARLRAHAAYEDGVLYPWAQQHLSDGEWHSLLGRLRHLRGPRLARAKREETPS